MRQNGYYWVKLIDNNFTIAEYSALYDLWIVFGHVVSFEDKDFIEIDERLIIRQPKHCDLGHELTYSAFCSICDNDE